MPKNRIIIDTIKTKSVTKGKRPYIGLAGKAVKVYTIDCTRATAIKTMSSHDRRQQTVGGEKFHAGIGIRRKTKEMEKVYGKICERESKDLDLLISGLARLKQY